MGRRLVDLLTVAQRTNACLYNRDSPSPVCVCTLSEALSHESSLGQSTLMDVYSCATPCMRQQVRPPFRWPQQYQCACVCFQKLPGMYLDRQRYTVLWPYTYPTLKPRQFFHTKTKIMRTSGHTYIQTDGQFFFSCT